MNFKKKKKLIKLVKFVTKFQLHLVWILLLSVYPKDKKALTSLFNCCLNSSCSLSKMPLYFSNSSAMINYTPYCLTKKLKWESHHLFLNSKWPLGKILQEQSHAAFPLADAFQLFYSMARTKVTPKKDERGREWGSPLQRSQEGSSGEGWRPPLQFITHPQPGGPCL